MHHNLRNLSSEGEKYDLRCGNGILFSLATKELYHAVLTDSQTSASYDFTHFVH